MMTSLIVLCAVLAVVAIGLLLKMLAVRRELWAHGQKIETSIAELKARNNDLTGRIGGLTVALSAAQKAAEEQAEALAARAAVAVPEARPEQVTAEIVGFLSLLQAKGRFVDFVMDDISKYSDAEVGAAARVVHQGCSSLIHEYFDIAPVGETAEGSPITLGADMNPAHYRLIGRAVGKPPYRGTVAHRGWRTRKVTLPRVTNQAPGHSPGQGAHDIIAPAEVEVG